MSELNGKKENVVAQNTNDRNSDYQHLPQSAVPVHRINADTEIIYCILSVILCVRIVAHKADM